MKVTPAWLDVENTSLQGRENLSYTSFWLNNCLLVNIQNKLLSAILGSDFSWCYTCLYLLDFVHMYRNLSFWSHSKQVKSEKSICQILSCWLMFWRQLACWEIFDGDPTSWLVFWWGPKQPASVIFVLGSYDLLWWYWKPVGLCSL